jgi:hypothetical protein
VFCSAQRPQAWPGACAATASVPVLSCLNARLPKGDRYYELGNRDLRVSVKVANRSVERRADAGKSKQMSAVAKGIESGVATRSSKEGSILNVVLVVSRSKHEERRVDRVTATYVVV